jgi:hypothetical protein
MVRKYLESIFFLHMYIRRCLAGGTNAPIKNISRKKCKNLAFVTKKVLFCVEGHKVDGWRHYIMI